MSCCSDIRDRGKAGHITLSSMKAFGSEECKSKGLRSESEVYYCPGKYKAQNGKKKRDIPDEIFDQIEMEMTTNGRNLKDNMDGHILCLMEQVYDGDILVASGVITLVFVEHGRDSAMCEAQKSFLQGSR